MLQLEDNGVKPSQSGWLGNRRRPRADLESLAAANLVASLSVAIVHAVQPFDHGVWLVAYLFLVGFLAQLLLGRGQVALLVVAHETHPPRSTRRAQLLLWNFGVLIVPVGVLAGTRLAVLLGSVALLSGLYSFWRGVREVLDDAWLSRAYMLLLGFMSASAVVGLALAWDIPWH